VYAVPYREARNTWSLEENRASFQDSSSDKIRPCAVLVVREKGEKISPTEIDARNRAEETCRRACCGKTRSRLLSDEKARGKFKRRSFYRQVESRKLIKATVFLIKDKNCCVDKQIDQSSMAPLDELSKNSSHPSQLESRNFTTIQLLTIMLTIMITIMMDCRSSRLSPPLETSHYARLRRQDREMQTVHQVRED